MTRRWDSGSHELKLLAEVSDRRVSKSGGPKGGTIVEDLCYVGAIWKHYRVFLYGTPERTLNVVSNTRREGFQRLSCSKRPVKDLLVRTREKKDEEKKVDNSPCLKIAQSSTWRNVRRKEKLKLKQKDYEQNTKVTHVSIVGKINQQMHANKRTNVYAY